MDNRIWNRMKGTVGKLKKTDTLVAGQNKDNISGSEELEHEGIKKVPLTQEIPEVGKGGHPAEEDVGESGIEARNDETLCPNCGVEIENDSKFCNICGEQIKGVKEEDLETGEQGGIEPWALKISEGFAKVPRSVKFGIPIAILIIAGGLIALFVIAGFHSPTATVGRYLSHLQEGEYRDAYDMIAHSSGDYSSYEYFKAWQTLQVDELGRLESFDVKDRETETALFGKVIVDKPPNGSSYIATLRYKKSFYDTRITVEPAGGVWPANKYRLQLSEDMTRLLVSPVGAEISIDGKKVGMAEASEILEDALSLGDLPGDLGAAVDYVKKVVRIGQSAVDEFKRVLVKFNKVADEAQWIFDRFSTSGFSWDEVADSVERAVQQGKDLGLEIARLAIKMYWVFGGGNDGSIRAKLTRAETGIDLENLPEGYHGVEVSLPGCKTVKETFFAPDGISIALEPTRATENSLRNAVEGYYGVYRSAVLGLNAEILKTVADGDLLEGDTQKVLDLMGKGMVEAIELKSRKYEDYKMLSETIATIKVREKWAIVTYQGPAVVSNLANVKHTVTYTLKQGKNGQWKLIEKKVD